MFGMRMSNVLIGALVPTAQAGVGTGMLLYFPMPFFAAVYLPLEVMPEGIWGAFDAVTDSPEIRRAFQDLWNAQRSEETDGRTAERWFATGAKRGRSGESGTRGASSASSASSAVGEARR